MSQLPILSPQIVYVLRPTADDASPPGGAANQSHVYIPRSLDLFQPFLILTDAPHPLDNEDISTIIDIMYQTLIGEIPELADRPPMRLRYMNAALVDHLFKSLHHLNLSVEHHVQAMVSMRSALDHSSLSLAYLTRSMNEMTELLNNPFTPCSVQAAQSYLSASHNQLLMSRNDMRKSTRHREQGMAHLSRSEYHMSQIFEPTE